MAKLIPASERIIRAKKFIQEARELPIPAEGGRYNFSYVAGVRDLLRQARDMVKFISMTPSATADMKAEVKKVIEEIERANTEILG
ncbi:MAG TPA: hypothetical protein PKE35_11935 [Anaerolineales bacterium]|nr:hypothetical protein [Anaerolineales bacterium]HMV97116.1 hypothetical protein [Anaerolineales bacterium]HMX20106.1 hypothetical protein [Anaerolineales bacterium]HMX74956.1 hypothetical protein [Anaerolineales bacterium]HMZ43176.1 hypothetical protein [Anaerolineales bacterium]